MTEHLSKVRSDLVDNFYKRLASDIKSKGCSTKC